jgi:hypothetical protein
VFVDVRDAEVVIRVRLRLGGGLYRCEGRVGGAGGGMVVFICYLCVIGGNGGRRIVAWGVWWVKCWGVCVGWGWGGCTCGVSLLL